MLKNFLLASAASVLALSGAVTSAQTVAATDDPMTTMPSSTGEESTTPSSTAPSTAVPSTDATTTTGSIPDTSSTTPVSETSTATDLSETSTATAVASGQSAAPAEGTIAAAVGANADLSTLGNALTATDLTATLGGSGPFTVFAPTNAAFDLIPAATRTQLMDPVNKESLATILKFHVVPGNITAAQLREQIAAGGGTASLQTVAGQTLRASLEGEQIVLMGENNSKAYIASADMAQTNGTVHVVNGILVPRLG